MGAFSLFFTSYTEYVMFSYFTFMQVFWGKKQFNTKTLGQNAYFYYFSTNSDIIKDLNRQILRK